MPKKLKFGSSKNNYIIKFLVDTESIRKAVEDFKKVLAKVEAEGGFKSGGMVSGKQNSGSAFVNEGESVINKKDNGKHFKTIAKLDF